MSRWYDGGAEINSVTLTIQENGITAIKVEWSTGKIEQSAELFVETQDLNDETKEKIMALQAGVLVLSELLAESDVTKDDPDEGMGWRS